MREQGFITPAQEEAARARAAAHPAVPAAERRARRLGEGISCGSSSATSSAAIIPPDWQVHTSFRAGGAGRGRARGRRRAASGCDRPGLEAALVAIDPQTGDILAMVGGAQLRAQHVQPRDAQPAAARLGVQAVRLRRGARARLLAGVGAVESAQRHARRAIRSGRRATRSGEQPDALTLRAALLESNNAAAADLQQRVGSRAVLRLAGDAGLSDLPDVPSLALGTGLVSPLDLTAAYTMFPGGGAGRAAARHASACSTPTAGRCSTSRSSASSVHQPRRSRFR